MSGTNEYTPRPPEPGETVLTVAIMNSALVPESQRRGFCLCIHPMMKVINMSGLTCLWCDQPMTEEAYTPEAKTMRTNAVKAAYPQFIKEST